MFNVELLDLQLSGSFSRTEKWFGISGQVRLEGEMSQEDFLCGTILFSDFKPVGTILEYSKERTHSNNKHVRSSGRSNFESHYLGYGILGSICLGLCSRNASNSYLFLPHAKKIHDHWCLMVI